MQNYNFFLELGLYDAIPETKHGSMTIRKNTLTIWWISSAHVEHGSRPWSRKKIHFLTTAGRHLINQPEIQQAEKKIVAGSFPIGQAWDRSGSLTRRWLSGLSLKNGPNPIGWLTRRLRLWSLAQPGRPNQNRLLGALQLRPASPASPKVTLKMNLNSLTIERWATPLHIPKLRQRCLMR